MVDENRKNNVYSQREKERERDRDRYDRDRRRDYDRGRSRRSRSRFLNIRIVSFQNILKFALNIDPKNVIALGAVIAAIDHVIGIVGTGIIGTDSFFEIIFQERKM